MNRLIGTLFGICLLRRAPQDLPYSPRLTQGLLLLAVGVDLLAMRLFEEDPHALPRGLLSIALLLGLPWLMLSWRGRSARYAQTLAAFLGTGLLFTLAIVPLLLATQALPEPVAGASPRATDVLMRGALFALVGWKLAINGHVWRHALDWPPLFGLPFAFALFVGELLLAQAFFPVAPASA
jgi:hypothetical protein